MKLLLVNYEYPPLGGGAGNATMNYAKAFAKMGHEVVVITSAIPKLGIKRTSMSTSLINSEAKQLTVYRIPAFRRHIHKSSPFQMLAFVISSFFYCHSIIKTHSIDKAIAFMSIPSGITTLFIKMFFKIPYVNFLGGGDVPGYQKDSDVFHKLIFPIRKAVLKNSLMNVAVSEGLAELSLKTDKYPTITIRTGVDVDFFSNPELFSPKNNTFTEHRTGNADSPINFIFVGRFTFVKQVELIVEQYKKLLSDGYNASLTLVGDGPTFIKVKELCEAGHNRKDHNQSGVSTIPNLIGWVDKTALLNLYQKCDVMINASTAEGLSNALLEAMSCGLVVIASNVIGNRDLIINNENGLLFDLTDPNGLYKAMKTLANDRTLLNRLKKKSRELVLKEYTWEASAKRYIALLNNK